MTVEPHAIVDARSGVADYNDDDAPPMRKGMPVTIVEDDTQAPDTSVVASFRTVILAGTEPPFRLLSQDRHRKKATIIIQPDPTAGGVTQSVMLSRQGQVSNNQGALFWTGPTSTISYEAESEMWAIPQAVNGKVFIVIIEERRTPRQ